MRNNDGDTATRGDPLDRRRQRNFAFSVQIGVRLIHHDEEGILVKRPGKPDPLALARGQRNALGAKLGLVPVRHADDHFVDAGGAGGLENVAGAGVGIEAGNILLDRRVHQRRLPAEDTPCSAQARLPATA